MRGSVHNLIRRSNSATYGGNPIEIVFIIAALVFVFLTVAFGPQLFEYLQNYLKRRQVLRASADEEAYAAHLKQDLARERNLAQKFEESAGHVAGLGKKNSRDRGGVCLVLDKRQAKMFKELNLNVEESEMDDVEEIKRPQKVRFKR